MLLLEQDTKRKGRINKLPEFETDDDKKYEMEAICNSAVYAKKVDGHLSELYSLIVWKGYPKKENIWEPFLAVMHL